MKKLLFVTYAFDHSTPVGVGAKRIVASLAEQGFQVFVVTSQNAKITIPNVDITVRKNVPRLPVRMSNMISDLFGKELLYFFWEIKAYMAGKKIIKNNKDVLAIYTRANPISVCSIGIRLKKRFNLPLMMHFTDPIPAPVEWCPNLRSRKRMIKQMKEVLPYANFVSFGNIHMLKYQEKVLGQPIHNKSFISPDPGPSDFVFLPPKDSSLDSVNLLFLGNIYGNRNPTHLFEAINELSNYHIKMYVYGNNNAKFPDFVIEKTRTADILSVMRNMDILIDIDGDDESPVFISSKIKDYLSVNRPILSITPCNSPSRELLCNLSTVAVSINETGQIKEALLKLLNASYLDSAFEERKSILKIFSSYSIAEEIIRRINSI